MLHEPYHLLLVLAPNQEMLLLPQKHVRWHHNGASGSLVLPLTKSGQRSGVIETVRFDDPLVVRLLKALCNKLQPEDTLFGARSRSSTSSGTCCFKIWVSSL